MEACGHKKAAWSHRKVCGDQETGWCAFDGMSQTPKKGVETAGRHGKHQTGGVEICEYNRYVCIHEGRLKH